MASGPHRFRARGQAAEAWPLKRFTGDMLAYDADGDEPRSLCSLGDQFHRQPIPQYWFRPTYLRVSSVVFHFGSWKEIGPPDPMEGLEFGWENIQVILDFNRRKQPVDDK